MFIKVATDGKMCCDQGMMNRTISTLSHGLIFRKIHMYVLMKIIATMNIRSNHDQ